MKFATKWLALSLVSSIALTGCVVAPPHQVYAQQHGGYAYTHPVAPPPNVVYVRPGYAAPSIGFVWAFHPRHGYGYHHPNRGWARGWR